VPLSYIGRGALVRATVTQESFEKIKVDEDDVVVYDVWLIRRCSGLVGITHGHRPHHVTQDDL
jgi:hypothetical protein